MSFADSIFNTKQASFFEYELFLQSAKKMYYHKDLNGYAKWKLGELQTIRVSPNEETYLKTTGMHRRPKTIGFL